MRMWSRLAWRGELVKPAGCLGCLISVVRLGRYDQAAQHCISYSFGFAMAQPFFTGAVGGDGALAGVGGLCRSGFADGTWGVAVAGLV